jgi:hypothetical protein
MSNIPGMLRAFADEADRVRLTGQGIIGLYNLAEEWEQWEKRQLAEPEDALNLALPVRTKDGREVSELGWKGGYLVGVLDGTLTFWHASGTVLGTFPFRDKNLKPGDDLVDVLQ